MQVGISADLGNIIIQAGKDVVHELELLAWSVRQDEAGLHNGDLSMLNL